MSESAIDLRDLDPPEPLLRILAALETDGAGPHVFLLAREPLPLYPLLVGQGWRRTVRFDERGCELTLRRESRIP